MTADRRTRNAPRPRESAVQRAIMAALRLHGWHVEKIANVAARFGSRFVRGGGDVGAPDLLCIKGAVAMRIEVKRDERSPLSPRQAAWHAAARKRGERVYVCWTVEQALACARDALAGSQGAA